MNLLAEMVEEQFGLAAWNELLEKAGYDGVYTAAGMYEDAELLDLVARASEMTGVPSDQLVFAFGEFMFPSYVSRYPDLIDGSIGFLSFLETIDTVIHVEVKKIYPGAKTPSFQYHRTGPESLVLRYQSDRKMCTLAEGLIRGAANHYQTEYTLEHSPCMKHGADHCGLSIVTQ